MKGLGRAVLLDRDGVLNYLVARDGGFYSPQHFAEFKLIARVVEACQQLKATGFKLLVVTNQPDINRGLMLIAELQKMHAYLLAELPIDQIYFCPHAGVNDKFNDACSCRKPLPGMLLQAATEHNIDLSQSFMIGDMPTDIEAGVAAGCRTIWLSADSKADKVTPDYQTQNLIAATDWILSEGSANKTA